MLLLLLMVSDPIIVIIALVGILMICRVGACLVVIVRFVTCLASIWLVDINLPLPNTLIVDLVLIELNIAG